MPARSRTALTVLIALLALVMAGGGTAVAAKIAKNSVTSKSIKNNAVKSKDLKDGSVESVDVKDGSVESVDLKDGSLTSTDVQDDGLTGADIAEGSLGTVPNATTVGGVQISPLSLSLPSTAAPVQVLSQSGTTASLDCGGALHYLMARAPSGPPILYTGALDSGNAPGSSLGPNESVDVLILDGQFTIAIVQPGGGSVTAEFTGIYETNAIGANDCFYRGTITRIP